MSVRIPVWKKVLKNWLIDLSEQAVFHGPGTHSWGIEWLAADIVTDNCHWKPVAVKKRSKSITGWNQKDAGVTVASGLQRYQFELY